MGEPGTTSGATLAGSSGAGGGATGGTDASGRKLEDMDTSTMTADELKLFIDTGRTGRRNALPDVTEEGVITTSTADVADAMNSLNFQSGNEPSTSSSTAQGKSS